MWHSLPCPCKQQLRRPQLCWTRAAAASLLPLCALLLCCEEPAPPSLAFRCHSTAVTGPVSVLLLHLFYLLWNAAVSRNCLSGCSGNCLTVRFLQLISLKWFDSITLSELLFLIWKQAWGRGLMERCCEVHNSHCPVSFPVSIALPICTLLPLSPTQGRGGCVFWGLVKYVLSKTQPSSHFIFFYLSLWSVLFYCLLSPHTRICVLR